MSVALSTSVYIVSMGKNVNWEWKWARTGVDLLVGEALGGLVAAEGVLGLVHESRHVCGFGFFWLVGMNWFVDVIVDGLERRKATSYLSTILYEPVAGALTQALRCKSMLRNVILSDGPTLWVLYVASCDGLQKVQEH